jgi:SAM-dependent methyltransferase
MHFYGPMLPEERTRNEVDFLVDQLGLTSGMTLLDVACGHGRHAIELARQGLSVTGIDRSEGFLALARAQADRQGVSCAFRRQDMREPMGSEAFDAVVCLFTAFGYFDEADNARVLACAAGALKPGGVFCVDVMNRDAVLRNFRTDHVHRVGEDMMIDTNRFDSTSGRLACRRTYVRDGAARHCRFSLRLYTFGELAGELARAGLQLERAFGSWDGGLVFEGGSRLIAIARKGGLAS